MFCLAKPPSSILRILFVVGKQSKVIIMESMLNKLKSTVTKVTADVTSAVMGNPVTREFDVGRHIASGGNGLAWKIFNGTKKSTKQVSL